MEEILLVLWSGLIGAAIGSFLNVVVFRLPRGKSLFYPPSHCPKCRHPIRWHDNIPVFGWLRLNGRCRDCGARISMRYPLIEAITGLGFALVVCFVVVLEAGPHRPIMKHLTDSSARVLLEPMSSNALWGQAAWVLILLMTLFVVGLIELDKPKLKRSIFVPWAYLPAGVIGLIGSLFWPFLHWVPFFVCNWPAQGVRDWYIRHGEWMNWGRFSGVPDAVVGMAAGTVLAWLTLWLLPHGHRRCWTVSLALLGLYLGWQHLLIIVPAALLVAGWVRVVQRRILPQLSLALVTFVVLFVEMVKRVL